MSQYEIIASGNLLDGVAKEKMLVSVQKLLPKANAAQLARFISGSPFVVTRVETLHAGEKIVTGLRQCGLDCSIVLTNNPTAYASKQSAPVAASAIGPVRPSQDRTIQGSASIEKNGDTKVMPEVGAVVAPNEVKAKFKELFTGKAILGQLKQLRFIIGWIFTLLFLVEAIWAASLGSKLGFVAHALLSLLVSPPVRLYAFGITKLAVPERARYILIVLSWGLASHFILQTIDEAENARMVTANLQAKKVQHEQAEQAKKVQHEKAEQAAAQKIEYWRNNSESILTEVKSYIAIEDYIRASSIAEKYLATKDEALLALYRDANIGKYKYLLGRAGPENYWEKVACLTELVRLLPGNSEYRSELERNTRLMDQADALDRQDAARTAARTQRREAFKKLLSKWDGSLPALVAYVKPSMNDPGSFEHDKTTFVVQDDSVDVTMAFRGKNKFNALVRNVVTARVTFDGVVIGLKSTN